MDLDHNEGALYIRELSLTSDIQEGEAEALSNTSKRPGRRPSAAEQVLVEGSQCTCIGETARAAGEANG